MKVCSTCNGLKILGDFHRSSATKDGLYPVCKECRRPRSLAYREKNGDKIRANWRQAHKLSPERHRENARKYQRENWEHRKAYKRDWDKLNPGKANAKTAKRHAAKLRATPPWITKQQKKDIEWFYIMAKDLEWLADEPLHVDHIHPLQGENFCGLHVPWNLRIIAASRNCSKQNKLEPFL